VKRLWKIVLAIAVAVVAGYLIWVAAATWFIRDGIYRVNGWNSEVDLSMGFAVSWLPGHISGRELRVVVHDSDAELDLQFDHFDLVVDVAQLANKRFVTTKTHLDGVKFYYRATRQVPELCKTKGLPPIGSQASPPPTEDCLQQTETANADTSISSPNDMWQVDLANIELRNVTDVWLDTYRFRGRGTVGESAFYLWPAQKIMVDGRTSHWSAEHVDIEGESVVSHASVDLSVKIDEVPTKDNAQLWKATSGTISVREADGNLDRFQYFAGNYRLAGEAAVDHGVPTLINAEGKVPNLSMRVGDKKLTGAFDVKVRGIPGQAAKTIHITEGRSLFSKIAVDGKAFPDEVRASILPGGVFATSSKVFNFEVAATCTTAEPAMALLPAGFGTAVTKIAVDDDDELTIAIRFKGPWDHMLAEPFTVRGGGLDVNGDMAISPVLKGTLRASLGPISKTIQID
jgi:hypothetical protein